MSFEYGDNLKPGKRKNTSPTRLTNILIVSGFIALGILIFVLMRSDGTISEDDLEATVDARINEQLSQPTVTATPLSTVTAVPPTATLIPSTPRPRSDGTTIVTGTSAFGEIADDEFEIAYSFEGQLNLPVIITLKGITLEDPELIIYNSFGSRVIATATSTSVIGTETVRVVGLFLDSSDPYTIIVTRSGGRTGDAEGEYELMVDIPPSLDEQHDINGTITSESGEFHWYTYRNDTPFTLVYNHDDGDYQPDVAIFTVNAQSEMVRESYIVGSQANRSETGTFERYTRYFIGVGDFIPDTTTYDTVTLSTYSIGIQLAR